MTKRVLLWSRVGVAALVAMAMVAMSGSALASEARSTAAAPFAAISDFDGWLDMSPEETIGLENAVVLSPRVEGDPQANYDAIVANLTDAGLVPPPCVECRASDDRTYIVPALLLAAKVVSCLTASYVAIRTLQNEAVSPDVKVVGIATALAGCVGSVGGDDLVKAALIKYKDKIAPILSRIGLGLAAEALLAADGVPE